LRTLRQAGGFDGQSEGVRSEQARDTRDSGALRHPQFQARGLWLGHDELERGRRIPRRVCRLALMTVDDRR